MTRAGLAAALAAVAATACLSVPPYQPPPSALTYTENAGGATISADGFALRFASGPGFHFPDALTVDGINTLGHSDATPCYAEDGVGMVIYPTPRISASTKAIVTTSQLTATMRGPAVVQVRVDWGSQFTCAGNYPFGSSLYTVFLDGRIVRHDSIDDHTTANTSSQDCACDPKEHQGFQIESFWTFDATKFTLMSVPGGTGGPVPLPTDPTMPFSKTNLYTACLDAGRYQVAVALSSSKDIVGTPKTTISPTLAMFDRERAGGFGSMLDPLGWETNDAVFVEHGTGCKKALDRASEHASASSLAINGAPATVSLVNGIYGGDAGDDGKPGVKVPPGRVELAGPINSSFAVWLRFTSDVDGVRAQLAGKTGAWYLLQRIDATNWIAWFRDPLMAGETIAIETD